MAFSRSLIAPTRAPLAVPKHPHWMLRPRASAATTATISGGSGSGATANVTGGVDNITVTAPGTGYTSAPTVNISGGGCPDIPYLNAEMVDKTLASAPHPNELGYTLCATMLQCAYEEALSIFNGGGLS